jgi:LEA14-like dessication related protein
MRLQIVAFLIGLISLSGCSNIEDVTVKEVQNVQVKNMDKNHIDLAIDVLIENPNTLSFKVKDVDLAIDINGQSIGKAQLSEGFSIKGNSSEVYSVELSAESGKTLQELWPSLLLSAFSQKIEVRIYGDIKGGALLLSKTFPVDHTEKVNLNDLNLNGLF